MAIRFLNGIDAEGRKILQVGDPTNSKDAANKAYVDAHDGGSGVYLPLSGGTMTGDINMENGERLAWTDGTQTGGLSIHSNSSNSFIQHTGTGYFQISNDCTGGIQTEMLITNHARNQAVRFQADNGNPEGTLSCDVRDYFILDGASAVYSSGASVAVYTVFPDKSYIALGTGKDLQIYHDGIHSYIEDTGTGDLRIKSNGTSIALLANANEDMVLAIPNGAVNLYYNNSKKFETTSTGVNITGSMVSSAVSTSAISVTGDITFSSGYLSDYIYHTGDTNTYFGFNANDQFRINCAGSTKFEVSSTQMKTYTAEITTSGSPQYFTYGGSGSQQLVFRENGPGGYKNSIIASAGGGVQLFYNNSEKLVTQSGGVSLGNNTLYLGQYSGINLNGLGPSAGKVIAGTGSSSQLKWVDSVANITVGTGLDISSSTSIGATTKNITLDFNELPVIDGDDPQADWFIVESSEDENSKINYSDLQNVDAHWKTFQTVITSNFDDRSSSTGIWYMPLNYISETTSANYYNTFACPRGGTVKRIIMMHTAGSTMSTSFTTELSIQKNGLMSGFSGELTPSNGSSDGSNITWSPNFTFTAGDRLNFRYQKSGTGKYWYGVSVSIIMEFDTF